MGRPGGLDGVLSRRRQTQRWLFSEVHHSSRRESERPVVILLGIETQIGLTIVRELGQRGVRVLGLARDTHAPGIYSRFLWKAVVRAGENAALVEQVQHLAQVHAPAFVMAISETDIAFLNRHRADFPGARVLVPEAGKMAIVLDKARTRMIAEKVGISVPRVWPIESMGHLESMRGVISFPVVLKWANPLAVMGALRAAGLSIDKYRYCYQWDELESYLAPFSAVGAFPIVQEYCPGHGLGQSIFMHNGTPLLLFQHRRVHEWPPEGGFSTLCEGIAPSEHLELQRKSIALLQEIGWEGPAMVEYRYDPKSDRAWLMEINGRFWGSLPLAHYSGAPFAWLTYSVLGLGAANERHEVKGGLRCRALVTEAKRLLRILFAPSRIQDRSLRFSRTKECVGFVADFFSLRTRYYVFAWADPKPAIYDAVFSLWRRARSALRERT